MKRILYVVLLGTAASGLGCKKVADNWRPTEFELRVRDLASNALVTYSSSASAEIKLIANKRYDFGLKVIDTSSSGRRDVTEEVQNENQRWLFHHVYIAGTGAQDALQRFKADKDMDGRPFGLLTSWATATSAASGKLRVQGRRDANKENATGGELFIDVLLNVSIKVESNGTAPTKMRYRLSFESVWSKENHPTNFPANPHFSPLVGTTHTSSFSLWAPEERATAGLKQVAETGGTSTIAEAIRHAIAQGDARDLLIGSGLSTSPSATQLEFDAFQTHPLISMVSMLAPSPDWFVGVRDVKLFENGAWVAKKELELRLYDAGTDSGTRFTSANAATDPPVPVARLTSASEDTDFRNGEPIVGRFTFTALSNSAQNLPNP